ncbi:MAG: hypothetical protein AAFX03_14560 [Pseudomonadota bacterium]
MWFLLFQIFLLLLLAALMGAALAYWWMKSRYEDVTDTHELLLDRTAKLDEGAPPATREDLDPVQARLTDLEAAVTGFAIPEPDLGGVNERLQMIEAQLSGPNDDVDAIHAKLAEMHGALASVSSAVSGLQNADLAPVDARLAQLEARLDALAAQDVDLGPVHSGIALLEQAIAGLEFPETDLEPLSGRLIALESKIAGFSASLEGAQRSERETAASDLAALSNSVATNLGPVRERLERIEAEVARPNTDLELVQARLDGLDSALQRIAGGVSGLRNADLEPLQRELRALAGQVDAGRGRDVSTDLEALTSNIASLSGSVSALRATDLQGLEARLARLEASLGAVRSELQGATDLSRVDQRLASLQEALISLPQPDMSPVIHAVRAIDSRMDLGALENRLTAIEYGLAALHHMARSRPGPSAFSNGGASASFAATEARFAPVETAPAPTGAVRPPRGSDPINAARRQDDKANLLQSAAFGAADDLEQISGVGPMLRELLNEIGVYYYWQIAEWTADEVAWVDGQLMHFRGRIERDNWVGQAVNLAALPNAAKRPRAPGGAEPYPGPRP